MSGYRLETFTPAEDGSGRPRRNSGRGRVEAVREAAYHAGFLEGQAMATEAHLDDQTRLTSAFIEALADARVTNEAARRHVAESIAPMIDALVDVDRADPRRRRHRPARSPASSSARSSTPRRRGRGCASRPSSATPSRWRSASAALARDARGGAGASCRARRRSSGTKATTISISTPASRKSAPASRRTSGQGGRTTMTKDSTSDDDRTAGRAGARETIDRLARQAPAPAPSSACRSR